MNKRMGVLAALALSALAGCQSQRGVTTYDATGPNPGTEGFVPLFTRLSTATRGPLERVVAFDGFQAVGLAVSPSGRLFLSSPRWHGNHGNSVVEVFTGKMQPPASYPNPSWNAWSPGVRPERAWVCVQALFSDDLGRLWVLDPGAPNFQGPVPGAPKLVRFTDRDKVGASYLFDETIAPPGSYLNDVRVDTEDGFAWISDSGLGAIVGVDLTTGRAMRFLEDHPSTKAVPGIEAVIGGKPWKRDGKTPMVNCDGIALSPDGDYVYYQALTGRDLYRVPTLAMKAALRPDGEWEGRFTGATAMTVNDHVEPLGQTFITDGMIMDENGVLYFTALERDAITARLPSGELVNVTADERISWPDSLAIHGGRLYFTTARIHETGFGRPEGPFAEGPYGVFRVPLVDVD
jgi:sugar lactone lactonase YvrE